jgi:hypothetical protein
MLHYIIILGLLINKILRCRWKTPIAGAAFVKDPRTQKVYLACGVSGEIVFWDVETRSVFKVFNYLDSLPKITAKHAKKQREFSSVLLFKHADRVLLLGGTFSKAICWDYDTKQIVYEIATPSESKENYTTRYCKLSYYHLLNIIC